MVLVLLGCLKKIVVNNTGVCETMRSEPMCTRSKGAC